jgi:ABC-type antimicrobial peptide transport system permease subunit
MAQHLRRAQAETRSLSSLTQVFGLAALAVAALGIYGAQAFAVAERRREFGVRLALGATPSRIGRDVMRDALMTAAGGVAAGLAMAVAAARGVRTLLFETPATDAATYAAAAAALATVAMVAAYVPARRAMRADPATVLRAE